MREPHSRHSPGSHSPYRGPRPGAGSPAGAQSRRRGLPAGRGVRGAAGGSADGRGGGGQPDRVGDAPGPACRPGGATRRTTDRFRERAVQRAEEGPPLDVTLRTYVAAPRRLTGCWSGAPGRAMEDGLVLLLDELFHALEQTPRTHFTDAYPGEHEELRAERRAAQQALARALLEAGRSARSPAGWPCHSPAPTPSRRCEPTRRPPGWARSCAMATFADPRTARPSRRTSRTAPHRTDARRLAPREAGLRPVRQDTAHAVEITLGWPAVGDGQTFHVSAVAERLDKHPSPEGLLRMEAGSPEVQPWAPSQPAVGGSAASAARRYSALMR